MKAFVKTCWLELALVALGLLAGLGAQPFLPEAVPRQWQGGQAVSTMPKLCLLLVPVIQLAVTMTVRTVLGAQVKKAPIPEKSTCFPWILNHMANPTQATVQDASWMGTLWFSVNPS